MLRLAALVLGVGVGVALAACAGDASDPGPDDTGRDPGGEGDDDLEPGIACGEDELACDDGGCFAVADLCDGAAQCADGSDEAAAACATLCPTEGDVRCADGSACVAPDAFCDGASDCADGSDERPALCAACGDDQDACDDGTCVELDAFCDGEPDCPDASDEAEAICGP